MTPTRRKRVRILLAFLFLTGISLGWMYGGCSTIPPVSGQLRTSDARSQELMAMAAAEAAMIGDVDQRLTRQLNLAETQRNRGWNNDAITTLAATRITLGSKDAAQLTDHARLSGWVSASELSRSVKDIAGATLACQGAQADLLKIEDPAKRCLYVMGVANETQYTQGIQAAAGVLTQAGAWTKSIDNVNNRKQAVVSFATALFNLDDYAAGQQMLRNEGDASWRSDVLAKMAMASDRVAEDAKRAQAQVSMSRDAAAAPAAARPSDVQLESNFYGKNLQYREVFQNQSKSRSTKD